MEKWANELNRTFSREEVQIAKKKKSYMKKCSPSLAIKKMQIQTTVRFYLTPVGMAPIKNTTKTNVDKDEGEKVNLHTLLVEMQIRRFPEKLKIELPYDLTVLLLGIYPKECK
jgi:hypothetical protein